MSCGPATHHRRQRTIRRTVQTCGIGFLTGADVTIRFLPAPPNHGVRFQRIDCRGSEPIPALIDFAVPRQRRTAIEHQGVVVEMTEHVLAALAGLHIDNCLVQIDAPEPPGGDGSALLFVQALLKADIEEQDALRPCLAVRHQIIASAEDGSADVTARPLSRPSLVIGYRLDYGPASPIPPQSLSVEITPETFLEKLAFARTFILETEIAQLRSRGYGSRTTARDLLVFGPAGVIDNSLRAADECVRHKILDCLGDFALLGCDLHGRFDAFRSGHRLNREVMHRLRRTHSEAAIAEPHAA
ncbi:MAG: UDP-3-O-acyl-N-acetylglucosamine deacetylase [Planctomycetaceae bacterium]